MDDLREKLSAQVPDLMMEYHVPGLSLALISAGEVSWHQEFGVRNAKSKEPVDQDTVFEAASLSKPVVAYQALKICEAGILDLDASLNRYLPEPYLPDEPLLDKITLRHVLSHTPGFPNWRPKGEALLVRFEPGSRFSYSGEGYVFLQAVIEQLTGQSPDRSIHESVLLPLGLSKSQFIWTGEEERSKALGHDKKGKPLKVRLWPEMNAASSLHCTPLDFAQFMCAVMAPSAKDETHLSHAMKKIMLTTQVQVNDQASWHKSWPSMNFTTEDRVGWGLGWGIQKTAIGESFWHWGDNSSFRAFTIGTPETGDGIIIMTNGEAGQQVISRILREIVGGEYPSLDWLEYLTR